MLYPLNHSAADPHKPAFQILETGEQVTFGELDKKANQVAQCIRGLGVKKSQHVALLMVNDKDFLEACFGMDRAGVYYTTISTRLTVDEIAYIVCDCAARVLIVSSELVSIAERLVKLLPKNVQVFSTGPGLVGYLSWQDALIKQSTLAISDGSQGLDMLYSSGTTGRPKGVKWPLPEQPPGLPTMRVNLLAPVFNYSDQTRYLSPAPLYHAAPLRHCMTVIKLGGTVWIMQSFDALRALEAIEKHSITHAQWVPTMFVRLLKLPVEIRTRVDTSSLKVALHAAAPCPVDIKEKMIEWWGAIIHEYYAGTENNGFCSITPGEWLQHKGSVGRASQGVLHICDEEGVELPVGQAGLVYFSQGPVFSYHNDPVRTAESRNAQGWTTLGDIGRIDEQGYLYLLDRRAFMIISGGVNIFPQEIENILIGHPKVMDVAVVGVPNEDLGEEVKAVVQPVDASDSGADLEAELMAYCRENLAAFKCPRSIDFDSNLPRHPTGKLYKKLVKDRYW